MFGFKYLLCPFLGLTFHQIILSQESFKSIYQLFNTIPFDEQGREPAFVRRTVFSW